MKTNPINVLHIIQGKHFGGAEQVVLTLSKCSNRDNVNPSILCLSEGLLLEKAKVANISHFLIPMGGKTDIFQPLLKTVKLIKEQNIDIVHTHTVRANLIGRPAALLTKRKCVTHLHSPILRDFADKRRGRINERIDSLTRFIADRYIAVSESLRREMIERGMSEQKIITVHNGLDLESLENQSKIPSKIREEYNIPQNAFVMVLVALLRPRKGVDLLIEASYPVLRQYKDSYLLIVGSDDISEDPDYGNKLHRLADESGNRERIIFTGFKNNIPSILKETNVLILPARFGEGLPMVILEAMAMGVPVIGSNIEGIPEVIEDGVNGFLVEAGNVGDLTNKIMDILRDKNILEKAAKSAHLKAIDEMSGFRQAQKIEEIYNQLIND